MIPFQRLGFQWKSEIDRFLFMARRGCEYNFANLYLWGRQEAAEVEGSLVLFSQFGRSSVYPFPVITGDPKPVLDAIIADAASRGIRCRITSLSNDDCVLLETLYPGRFQFYPDRDSYDYVYAIDALADLKGKKLQRKRNHLNRFKLTHPGYKPGDCPWGKKTCTWPGISRRPGTPAGPQRTPAVTSIWNRSPCGGLSAISGSWKWRACC